MNTITDNNPDVDVHKKIFIANTPFPFNVLKEKPNTNLEDTLSIIVSKLHRCLLTSSSKYLSVRRTTVFSCPYRQLQISQINENHKI